MTARPGLENEKKKIDFESSEENEDRLFYILVGILSLILFVLMFQARGYLKWSLAVMVLLSLGTPLIISIHKNTKKKKIWNRDSSLDEELYLKMEKTSKLVNRAFKGQKMSQDMLKKRLRKICLRKIKSENDLSDEKIKRLCEEPERLREAGIDDHVVDFIFEEGQEESLEKKKRAMDEKRYEEKVKKTIKIIEEDKVCER